MDTRAPQMNTLMNDYMAPLLSEAEKAINTQVARFQDSPIGALVQGKPEQFLPRAQTVMSNPETLQMIQGGFGPHGSPAGGALFHSGIKNVGALDTLAARNRITASQLRNMKGTNTKLTTGQIQQSTQNPNLTGYEQAMNTGNVGLMETLRRAHPNDPRFAIHLQIPMLSGGVK